MISHRDAQCIAADAVQARLRRTLRELAATEVRLDQIYREVASEIRERLGATQYSEAEVERVAREAFERSVGERTDAIERSVRVAAEEARQADPDTVRRIFGDEGAATGARPFVRSAKPRLSLVPPSASEDDSPETD